MCSLSIVIPVNNTADYLPQCLDSILVNNHFTGKVICVDDGSTDHSLEILLDYQSKYLNLEVYTQQNGGASRARNVGLTHVDTEYVFFMDSDDFMLDGKLDIVLHELNQYHPEILCFNADQNNGIKRLRAQNRIELCDGERFCIALEKQKSIYPCVLWMYVYSTGLIKKLDLKFIEGICCEDVDFTIRMIMSSKKVIYIPNSLVYYRTIRDGSVMFRRTKKHAFAMLSVGKGLLEYQEKTPVLEIFKKYIFSIYMEGLEWGLEQRISILPWVNKHVCQMLMQCSTNIQENRTSRLICISPILAEHYYHYKVNNIIRKLINIVLR